jgi:hypothetical protein
MPDTITPNLGMTIPAHGEENYDALMNPNLVLIDTFAGSIQTAVQTQFKDAWSASTTYVIGQIVTLGGDLYINAIANNVNNTPTHTSSAWTWVATTITNPGVLSFKTRTGAVVPASGDYTAAEVTNALDSSNPDNYVESFNGRVGVVVSVDGDYTAAQVTNALDSTNPTNYVASFAGRVGDVVAVTGDYNASQVTDAFDLSTSSTTYNGDLTIGGPDGLAFTTEGAVIFFANGNGITETLVGSTPILQLGNLLTLNLGSPNDPNNGTWQALQWCNNVHPGGAMAFEITTAKDTGFIFMSGGGDMDPANALELQFGCGVNPSFSTPPAFVAQFGIGDVSTIITNTNIYLRGIANFDTAIAANAGVANNAPSFAVFGSTSGSATFTQPDVGPSYKRVLILCSTLLGTASWTFPVPFLNLPNVNVGSQSGALAASVVTSISTTAVTVTGATSTGFLTLDGF